MVTDASQPEQHPGERLGLPEHGSGSLARWGHRIAALFIDWAASTLLAIGLVGYASSSWPALGIYFLEASVFTSVLGGSFGQVVLRLAVVRVDGTPLPLLPSLLRHLLICLVIPAVIWDQDRRGLHDMVARTVVLRR